MDSNGPKAGLAVCIVVAAGSGERLGAGVPKAFVPLLGQPLLAWSLGAIGESGRFDEVVVVAPEGWADRAGAVAESVPALPPVALVVGGATRQGSVRAALEAAPDDAEVTVCHDAARPLAGPDLFGRVLLALAGADGAVPVLPVADTVKLVREGVIEDTIPRHELGLAQTPQAFLAGPLRASHRLAEEAGLEGTDDAALLERAGYRVVAVAGDPDNLKVTSPEDLARAEAILGARRGPESFRMTR
jgi:2-C-methyl-D-erythritol 4-phosphate cytidylyltransferase